VQRNQIGDRCRHNLPRQVAGCREISTADHQRTPDQEDYRLTQAPLLEAQHGRRIADRAEQTEQGEGDHRPTSEGCQGDQDDEVERVQHQEGDHHGPPRRHPRQNRMWRVKRARIVGGVGAQALVEDVVHEVVAGMGEHYADGGQQEQPDVEARGTNRQQAGQSRRGQRHRLDASAREDEPAADDVVCTGRRVAGRHDHPPCLEGVGGAGGFEGGHQQARV